MRKRILGLAIIAAALLSGTGCAAVNHQVGQSGVSFAGQVRPALVPQLVTAEAAAEVATTPGQSGGQQCLHFTQTTRGGTTSLQTGGWNCGGMATPYGYGQTAVAPYTGMRPGEAEALAARGGYGPGAVGPSQPPPAGATTDPVLTGRVQSLEQSLQAVINAQAEEIASKSAR